MSEIEKYYNGTMHIDFEEEDLIAEIIVQHNEIEKLKSIIKEVREEIEYFELQAKHFDDSIYLDERLTNKLLQILEKEK